MEVVVVVEVGAGAATVDETGTEAAMVESTARAAPMMLPSALQAPTREARTHSSAGNRFFIRTALWGGAAFQRDRRDDPAR